MKRRPVFLLSMAFVLACHFYAYTQVSPANALESYATSDPGEKLFAHLSRTDLITGELLWFSLFQADRQTHRPLDLSKVAYAELIGPDGKAVLRTRVFMDSAAGYGSFYLPATLETGEYLFRAYTSWMKNMDPAFWFNQPVRILNTVRSSSFFPMPAADDPPVMTFFPEGGNMVQGLKSRVAFHAVDRYGDGVPVKGWIMDGKDTVVRFRSIKHGLGSFRFRPLPGRNYQARFKDARGRVMSASLPVVAESGVVLTVNDSVPGTLSIVLCANGVSGRMQLVIHSRQKVLETKVGELLASRLDFNVPLERLPSGISHITIFDDAGRPVAERLWFRKPQLSTVDVVANQKVFNVRSRASLSLNADTGSPNRYSVSVFRADSLPLASSIASYLLLTSDLKGKVEDPDFYLSNDPLSPLLVDHLMLTHGWRRFDWTDVVSGRKPLIRHLPELNGHLIEGTIMDANGVPAAGRTVFLSSPSKVIRLFTALSDDKGKVLFDISRRDLGSKVVVQPDLARDSLLHLEMEESFSDLPSPWKRSNVKTYGSMAAGLIERNVAMQVQDAFHEEETFFNYPPGELDSIPFYGRPTEVYDLDDYVRFPEMEEVMREFVKGVWVRKRGDRYRLIVLDRLRNVAFGENPLTLLDGVPVPDINRLFTVDPIKVNRIEVLSARYFLGPLKRQGIVSLSSYNGDFAGMQPDPRSVVIDYGALERERRFHSPTYGTFQSRDDRVPDRRHLVLFDPVVRSKDGASSVVEFFTSDVEGKFIVVVEGLSDSGLPVHGVTTFSVSRD